MCLRVNSRATNFPFIASPIKTSMKNPTVRSDPPSDIKKKIYIYIYKYTGSPSNSASSILSSLKGINGRRLGHWAVNLFRPPLTASIDQVMGPDATCVKSAMIALPSQQGDQVGHHRARNAILIPIWIIIAEFDRGLGRWNTGRFKLATLHRFHDPFRNAGD